MAKKKKFVEVTSIRELTPWEFQCKKCKKIHEKSAYAIAQAVMKVKLIFTCDCGNKINL